MVKNKGNFIDEIKWKVPDYKCLICNSVYYSDIYLITKSGVKVNFVLISDNLRELVGGRFDNMIIYGEQIPYVIDKIKKRIVKKGSKK